MHGKCVHCVFDLWCVSAEDKTPKADVTVVRWGDDFVGGFQHRLNPERFDKELLERFAKFKMKLN